MRDRELSQDDLERLTRATDAIRPDDRFADAVMAAVLAESAVLRADRQNPSMDLDAIATATSAIGPSADLTDAVMARVRASSRSRRRQASWLDGVVRSGPIAIGMAAIAFLISAAAFRASERDLQSTLAASVDSVEVDE